MAEATMENERMKIKAWRLPTEDGNPMGYSVWKVSPSFAAAVGAYLDRAPDVEDHTAWEYIQIVPINSLEKWWKGNDGAQAWRHIETGYTIPDFCRQTAGYPEVWTRADAEGAEEVEISEDSPVWRYIIEH